MYLLNLSVEDFGPLPRASLPFTTTSGAPRRFTALAGPNGAGKSTLLRAAALLLGGRATVERRLGDPNRWIRGRASSCRIEAAVRSRRGEQTLSLELRRGDALADVLERNRATFDYVEAARSARPCDAFVAGFGPGRLSGAPHALQGLGSLFPAESLRTSFDEWACAVFRALPDGFLRVDEAVSRIFPGLGLKTIDVEGGRVMLTRRHALRKFWISTLDDGRRSVFEWYGALFLQLAERFGLAASPFEADGLVLVDEVELHLQPEWRRTLREVLLSSFPRLQFVVTTHSALVAQQAEAGELFQVLCDDGRHHVEPFPGAPHHLTVAQLYATAAFGLETGESRHVQRLRSEYRSLRQRAKPTRREAGRLSALTRELEALPDARRLGRAEKRRQELFAKLADHLGKSRSRR